MKRLIGYSLICIAVGLLISLFIENTIILFIIVGVLLLIGYRLFCCR